jgi:hypothetical protein
MALTLAACASAQPQPAPPSLASPALTPAPAAASGRAGPPARPPPPTDATLLDEAARLLADGVQLERADTLLAAVAASPRRDLLLGQLAELTGDDPGAVAAYDRVLARGSDDEVRLRRALALERMGRAAEVAGDLRRLRPDGASLAEPDAKPTRQLRPLKPSSR